MTRSKSAVALALVGLLGLSVTSTARAIDFAQSMGFGYGPGYNAPAPASYGAGYNGSWPYCSWSRGCCEIPASWRQHVWDGYRGDGCTWHTSFCGVPKQPLGSGYAPAGCPTCQPGSAQSGSGYATPATAQQPVPSGSRPVQY